MSCLEVDVAGLEEGVEERAGAATPALGWPCHWLSGLAIVQREEQ
jgi:hypothetical protein